MRVRTSFRRHSAYHLKISNEHWELCESIAGDGTHAAGNAGVEGTNNGIAKEDALSGGQAIFTDDETSGNMN
jgi:hypothetical protein